MEKRIQSPQQSFLRVKPPPARTPFRVRTLGRIVAPRAHSTRGTYFGDAMLTLVVDGKGLYRNMSDRIVVEAGMVGVVLPEDDAGYLESDPVDPYTHYYCRFAGDEGLRMARAIRNTMTTPFARIAHWPELRRVFEEILEQGNIHQTPGVPYMRPEEIQFARILSLLLFPPLENSDRKDLNAASLTAHMLDRLGDPVSLEQSAREFGMGKARFCREVKSLLGTTYQKAMEREKMAWASSLLRDRSLGLGVAEVAHRVGYNDPLYFSKVFKRAHGLSPRRFQREILFHRGS